MSANGNGKMLRIYEKGKQLGDSESPWVRVEAELRNKSRVIPWDALTRPGSYLAGAYPCLAYLSGRPGQDKDHHQGRGDFARRVCGTPPPDGGKVNQPLDARSQRGCFRGGR